MAGVPTYRVVILGVTNVPGQQSRLALEVGKVACGVDELDLAAKTTHRLGEDCFVFIGVHRAGGVDKPASWLEQLQSTDENGQL